MSDFLVKAIDFAIEVTLFAIFIYLGLSFIMWEFPRPSESGLRFLLALSVAFAATNKIGGK